MAVASAAPRSRQITMPAPTTQFFTGQMPFLLPNQQRQSTEGTQWACYLLNIHKYKYILQHNS